MRILIAGAGAMGCLFAARLKKAGHEVSLLEILQERVDEIGRKGIRVEGVTGRYRAKVQVSTKVPASPPDLALICVKAYDTPAAARGIQNGIGPATWILTLQNGLGNLETLSELLGEERVLGGVTAEGATVLAPGRIRHAGQGETIIQSGPFSETIVQTFSAAGFRSRAEDHIQNFIWGKLLVNVGINAIAALTRLKNGRVPELEGSRQVMMQAVEEAVAICKARKIVLPYPDPARKVEEVCRDTAANIASMLQDVLKRRRTEIAYINGAIVQEGERLGLPTPVNRTLTGLISAIEETYSESL